MRILLSTIGSRGDVQPLVALALALRTRGQQVRLCTPPDFCDWIAGLGFEVTPLGPELRNFNTSGSPPSPEQLRLLAEQTVITQFDTIQSAASTCQVLVGATALQIAAPSIAERLGIPYVFAAYCPAVLPSPHHPPTALPGREQSAEPSTEEIRDLWSRDADRFNLMFGATLNTQRVKLGLAPVEDVRSHVLTSRPWLAADPTLGPWPERDDACVFQTGAWIVPDQRPLSFEVEAFLDAGEPPVYFGFGSIRVAPELGQSMLEAARRVGRRGIISRGWAELAPAASAPDCLVVDEVNQQTLFKRVAAVVHHGGAGTTTTAALAGAPQVVVPRMYDQHYWAKRVASLGIGSAHAPGAVSVASLGSALEQTLSTAVSERARALAPAIRLDGAERAAQALIAIKSV